MIAVEIYRNNNSKPVLKQVNKAVLRIGRSKDSDISIDDDVVSNTHMEIILKNKEYFVYDLTSRNGTFVNQERIPSLKEIKIHKTDVITVGHHQIKIALNDDTTNENERKVGDGFKNRHPQINRIESTNNQSDIMNNYRDQDLIELKVTAHKRLLEIIELRRLDFKKTSDAELRQTCDRIVRKTIQDIGGKTLKKYDEEEIIKDVLDEAIGLGPIEDLINDPAVSEIMVNRADKIYIERNGTLTLSPKVFSDNKSVGRIISRIVGPLGRRIDESSPMVDARLKDGSRVNVIIPPLALDGPCLTIRKFSKTPLKTENLIQFNSLTAAMAEFIKTCVINKQNVLISGGTGSGKTTLLNIFSSFIPDGERVVTIEDAAELQLPQEHVIRLESRPPNIEGEGEISIQQLVKNALRMRPDRIIVGECRGGEALDMLQAMNTGHDGSLTTAHANSPSDMISRLETMVLQAGKDLPSRAIREQIASAIDIIIQQTRFSCGSRKIINISEVVGIEDGKIVLQDIFYFRQQGFDSSGKTTGKFMATGWIPDFYEKMQQRGLEVDMSIFHN